MDLSKLSDLAGGLGKGLDQLDLQQVITDQFMKDNTTLDSVQALLNKLGVGSLVDLNKISPEILDQVVQSISKFGSWKDLLAKAAGSGLGDKLGGFFK